MTAANPFLGHSLRHPRLSASEAAEVAHTVFGIEGDAVELGSQQDQNFRIDGRQSSYVLKVANPAFGAPELDLQNRAMEHVAARLKERVPVALRSPGGGDVVPLNHNGQCFHVRLLPFLEGTPLRVFGYLAPAILRAAGDLAGRVAAALASFEHPAAKRTLQWNVCAAADVVAAFAPEVRDPHRRAMVERAMEGTARALASVASELREQIIHGDVNGWNVLAEHDRAGRPSLCGIIDFGDVSHSWTAAECAVLACGVAEQAPARPLQAAIDVVRGFHAAMPLEQAEVAALPALIAARAALSAVSCEQQVLLEPESPYVAESFEAGWTRLATIASIPPPLAHAAFRDACGLTPPSRPVPAAAAPIVKGLRDVVAADLSARTDELTFGSWRDPAAIRRAVEPRPGTVAIGRHGERRLVHDVGPELSEPETVHLGVDLFVEPGTSVLAPLAGRIISRSTREVLLSVRDGLTLRLAGVEPAPALGAAVEPGEAIGRVAPVEQDSRLPAHVHVQLVDDAVDDVPGLVPPSLAAAWSAICPDPAPMLGFDPSHTCVDPVATLNRRRRFIARSQVLYYPTDPPVIERGWRQWLYDIDGRPYLDVVNNVAVVGHSHPRVEAAAARQLRRLNTNTRFLYDAMGRFGERLAGLLPSPLEVVYLVNSGSEANDLALRLARETTGHEDVVCLEDSYHGWTGATDELLHSTRDHVLRLVKPNPYAGRYRDDPAALARYAREAVAAVARRVEDGHPPAAFICEPYLGNSGGVTLPDGYLRAVYAAMREAGGVCIADEVQVGYGRLGRYFWAFEQQGVVPDIVTIAKAAGNGHPVAAVITTRELADRFAEKTDIFSSVGGTPVSCEIGLAVLDVIEEERLQENAIRVGDHLTERVGALVGRYPNVGALHGIGLYRGLELVHDAASRQPAPLVAAAICERMRSLGVIVQPTGKHANVLKLKPPLCVSCNDIDFFAEALELTLAEGW